MALVPRRWICLGGWCGPSLMLSKLGVRASREQLVFDMVRCTFDGMLHFIQNDFKNAHEFFPGPLSSRPWQPDPVSIWLLFRGQHTCFTHFNLNADAVVNEFHRRIEGFMQAVERPAQPITFLRTCIAENAMDELEMVPQLFELLHAKSRGHIDMRLVMVVHEKANTPGATDVILPQRTSRVADFRSDVKACVWRLVRQQAKRAPDQTLIRCDSPSLFDQCHDGYEEIIRTMSSEAAWSTSERVKHPDVSSIVGRSFPAYRDLCLVEGVPAVKGSCTGFGSTYSAAIGRCVHCGSADGHAFPADQFDRKPRTAAGEVAWTAEEDEQIVRSFVDANMDHVAAVESAARVLQCGANETLQRMRTLLGPVVDAEMTSPS